MTVIVVYTTNTEGKVNLQKQLIDKKLICAGENINIVMMKKVNGHHSYFNNSQPTYMRSHLMHEMTRTAMEETTPIAADVMTATSMATTVP